MSLCQWLLLILSALLFSSSISNLPVLHQLLDSQTESINGNSYQSSLADGLICMKGSIWIENIIFNNCLHVEGTAAWYLLHIVNANMSIPIDPPIDRTKSHLLRTRHMRIIIFANFHVTLFIVSQSTQFPMIPSETIHLVCMPLQHRQLLFDIIANMTLARPIPILINIKNILRSIKRP